ncbi:bacteriocin biosynthesis cyclodehydratase domain-containing protein [Streptomyces sp. B4I13]|uniref:TOMM precursor leader peptide-binding protein n=1 Tax=Streptomyces sp. B4I13 TaxID=3042271 RepID=UPI00277D7113|nr:TOMM precursor leader peptide-binding protein [Streptomyces sp. B4I13]MDQ0960066.1 bacteriocin biosynthesis cyclodehydratase domain-containing protein [Streptomyces sp. B4I13]
MIRPASEKPRLGFKEHLTVQIVPGEAVYLMSGRRVTTLHGAEICHLAELLDGARTRDAVLAEASGRLPAERTLRLLDRLTEAGLLAELPASRADDAAERAYWEAAGLSGGAVRPAATVHTLAVGGVGPETLHTAAVAAGLRTGPAAEADLVLVACDDYLDPRLRELDREYREAGRCWLPIQLHGTETWIGPFLGAPDGPCWSCLAERLWRSRPVEARLQQGLGRSGPLPRRPCAVPASLLAGLHLAVLEAVKWLAGLRHPGQDALWTLNGLMLTGGHHPVSRRPQCPDCGDPTLVAARVEAPVVLTSRPKADSGGGGHRALGPEEMLRRYGHHVDPLTGLVREIRRDPRGPAFLNVFHAGHNLALTHHDPRGWRTGLRATSAGKGSTPLRAKVSALAEVLERHSGHLQGDEPMLHASYDALGEEAVHPDSVQLFAAGQFTGRARWNAEHGAFQQVCEPFDEGREIEWTPVWSLTEERRRLLPTALLYFGASRLAGRPYCLATSNGVAAGASLEDAVLQGFLELVERDAVALWWYNRLRRPGVDLGSFEDPWIAELRTVHASLHREVWALDLTADLGIPTVVALSRRTDKAGEDITLGFGAHFDPRIALHRALTELNQMLPYVVDAGADGGGYGTDDAEVLRWMRTARAAELPYLRPDPERPAMNADTHPYRPRVDLREDVAEAERIVREAGLDMLVLDQTRPDVGLPVARVIVPGLRPHWARFAPGRLYDVPVRSKDLTEPTRYEDLNPVPLFL